MILLLGLVALAWVWWASQRVPEFYRAALQADVEQQAAESDQLIHQALELSNDARAQGQWEALFTVGQINGWLAVDLVQNHSHLLPDGVRDPRVAISPSGALLAFRYDNGSITTVFSVDLDVCLAEPNVIALRVRGARAGELPLPLADVLDGISQAARHADLRLRWAQDDDHPVALVTLPLGGDEDDVQVTVQKLELREGAIYVAGRSTTTHAADASVGQSPSTSKVQR